MPYGGTNSVILDQYFHRFAEVIMVHTAQKAAKMSHISLALKSTTLPKIKDG